MQSGWMNSNNNSNNGRAITGMEVAWADLAGMPWSGMNQMSSAGGGGGAGGGICSAVGCSGGGGGGVNWGAGGDDADINEGGAGNGGWGVADYGGMSAGAGGGVGGMGGAASSWMDPTGCSGFGGSEAWGFPNGASMVDEVGMEQQAGYPMMNGFLINGGSGANGGCDSGDYGCCNPGAGGFMGGFGGAGGGMEPSSADYSLGESMFSSNSGGGSGMMGFSGSWCPDPSCCQQQQQQQQGSAYQFF